MAKRKRIVLPAITLDARKPLDPNFHIKPSTSSLDFWGKLYEDQNGVLLSPGFVDYTPNKNIHDIVKVNLVTVKNGQTPKTADWVTLPGICMVHFARMKNKDSKKPVGVDSTTTTTSGIKAAEIIIELTVWTPQHWIDLKRILPLIIPKARKDRGSTDSFQVHHPVFALHGVNSVVFYGAEGPTMHSTARAKHFKLHCIEWMPQTKVKAGTTAPPPSRAKEVSEAKIGLASYPPGPGQNMSIDTGQNQSIPEE